MKKVIAWGFVGLFSLSFVFGFQYVTDQFKNEFHYTGLDIQKDVERNELQMRFDEAHRNGEVENLSL